ncbi:DUF4178 domain-containing protein [Pontivivens ytuae]|uniref:DUF4178 domain-containing protein n=1 Tax=Pontivivens ytuae TaxID=2789856 RepID=A0A7S9LSV6_9RHOB|nr:DUF4178 domain-containing protein [Pontivivens ytuae]QPH54612.1 DUF4178 domain-containing protein [Pontivivens ytuae]
MALDSFNCANCGAPLAPRLAQSKMIDCAHCHSTSVLMDDGFRLAGSGGVMHDMPSLVTLVRDVAVEGLRLTPLGHARYDYGRGWWDEYWCIDQNDDGWWLSVDEGDYAIEQPLPRALWPRGFRPRLGTPVAIDGTDYRVTEAETAECIAVRGELPEVLSVGEKHLYFDLSGPERALATVETWEGGEAWTRGRWVDPWDVQTL